MSILDDLLAKYKLKYEDLDTPGHSGELKTLLEMQAEVQKGIVNVESAREHVAFLRSSVEKELVDTDEFEYFLFGLLKRPNRKQIYLKARLKNYLILEAYFSTPEQMKERMEDMLGNIKKV